MKTETNDPIALAKKLMVIHQAAQKTLDDYYASLADRYYPDRLGDNKNLAYLLEIAQMELGKPGAKITRCTQVLVDPDTGEQHRHGTITGESLVRIGSVDKGRTVLYHKSSPLEIPPLKMPNTYWSTNVNFTVTNDDGDHEFVITAFSTDEGITAFESLVDWTANPPDRPKAMP